MSGLQVSPATTDFLSLLSPAARERLSSTSRRVDYPAASILYRPGEGERVVIITRGIVRIYFQNAEGRQATVLFGHPGSMLGVVNVLGEIPNLFAQAIVRASAIQIDHRVLRDLINRDLSTAKVVAGYLATRLRKTMELVGLRTSDRSASGWPMTCSTARLASSSKRGGSSSKPPRPSWLIR